MGIARQVFDSHLLHVDSSAQTCPGLAAPNIDLEIELFNMLLATTISEFAASIVSWSLRVLLPYAP